MSEWYVSQVNVRNGNKEAGEPGIVMEEHVLTIKAPYRAAHRSYQVFRSLGTPNVGLYCWDMKQNKKSYAASLKSQKRRRGRKLTKADLAPALMELAKEDANRVNENSDTQEG